MGYSLRVAEWRYTEWIHRHTGEILERELYAMSDARPMETKNLAGLLPARTAGFSAMLHRYLDTAPKWGGPPHG